MILILDFTEECNSRCKSCHRWTVKHPVTLDMTSIENLISGLPLEGIYVTGGEPFIHENVVDIARLLSRYHPTAYWESATNCISPLTEQRISEIQALGIQVRLCLSLEGNREQHDASRGVKGNYDRVMEVKRFCDERCIPYYFSTVSDEGLAEGNRLGVLTDKNFQRFGKRFGDTEGVEVEQVINDCPGGTRIVCADPWGDVWACEMYRDELHIGNIHEQDIGEMRFAEVAEYVKEGCGPCTMSCWF